MKKIKINIDNFKKGEINLIVDFLKQGKVIVYPTDTVYGLGCLATEKEAIKKIYRIKKRRKDRPLLILVSSLRMLKKYCYINKKQNEYLKEIWSKSRRPTSVVLQDRGLLPNELTGGLSSLAVRLPKNDFLIKTINSISVPLVSTSLNISSRKVFKSVEDLDKYFKKHKPDLVVDTGRVKMIKPSRLVDIRNIENIKLLRK